jgi:hypothetical protein
MGSLTEEKGYPKQFENLPRDQVYDGSKGFRGHTWTLTGGAAGRKIIRKRSARYPKPVKCEGIGRRGASCAVTCFFNRDEAHPLILGEKFCLIHWTQNPSRQSVVVTCEGKNVSGAPCATKSSMKVFGAGRLRRGKKFCSLHANQDEDGSEQDCMPVRCKGLSEVGERCNITSEHTEAEACFLRGGSDYCWLHRCQDPQWPISLTRFLGGWSGIPTLDG